VSRLEKAIARRIARANREGTSSYAQGNATQAGAMARLPYVQKLADRRAAKSGKVYVHGLGDISLPEGVTVEEFQREVEAMQARLAHEAQAQGAEA
jgi:hypothetical protein